MKTAVDSSVLIDVLGPDREFGEKSRSALRAAYDVGALLACEVVWAELRAHFQSDDDLTKTFAILGIRFDPLSVDAALLAGKLWRLSRKGRNSGKRVVADFLIGAHAMVQGDALLSRDRGFYRRYFSRLKLIEPA
jgi:predicted nucleic acid-binding protein